MNVRLPPKWLILLGCTLGLFLVLALASGNAQAQDAGQELPYDEKEAQSIDRMLLCPVCPAETIDQAQVPLARQMRSLVREMLAQGADREEILDFFADRYGLQVLAAPPKSGVNLLAWVLPVVLILAALGGGFVIIRAMAARGPGRSGHGNLPPRMGWSHTWRLSTGTWTFRGIERPAPDPYSPRRTKESPAHPIQAWPP